MAKKAQKKAGRPKANIDWALISRKLQAGSKGTTIARSLGIEPNTFYRRCEEDNKVGFSEFLSQKIAEGNDLIYNKQFEVAMKGNVSMLIWIGKQRLGQRDKNDLTSNNESFMPKQIELIDSPAQVKPDIDIDASGEKNI
ncbi:MAG: hypothetical protein M3367_03050 [Acidobacteriota bacterium]|nr:hypothetical protein [Acidobacteriota bacterium]